MKKIDSAKPAGKAAAAPSLGQKELSISVRPIEGGYITRHSKMDGNGYSSREVFSKEEPSIEPGRPSRMSRGGLGEAVGLLKGKNV